MIILSPSLLHFVLSCPSTNSPKAVLMYIDISFNSMHYYINLLLFGVTEHYFHQASNLKAISENLKVVQYYYVLLGKVM